MFRGGGWEGGGGCPTPLGTHRCWGLKSLKQRGDGGGAKLWATTKPRGYPPVVLPMCPPKGWYKCAPLWVRKNHVPS